MARNILVVEDDRNISDLIRMYLEKEGFDVRIAYDGGKAVEEYDRQAPDMVLLDIMLPGLDGYDLLASLKPQGVPVIFLTAKSAVKDRVLGLRLGADDYITKPFGTGELMARIRTSLRHSHAQAPGHVYKALDLEIDFEKRLIRLRGEEVHLTQIEYQLLTLLAENSGRVLTYSYIMNAIWGPYMDNNNQILRVNMANIRRKLEQNPAQPQYVFTEIGVGYRMRENENGGTV